MVKSKQLTLDTDEYRVDRQPISGGSIDSNGLTFKLDDEIDVNTGQWGNFYSMPVEYLNDAGEWAKGVINFTHRGLFKLVTANHTRLLGQEAVIKGEGTGVNRKYTIELKVS